MTAPRIATPQMIAAAQDLLRVSRGPAPEAGTCSRCGADLPTIITEA